MVRNSFYSPPPRLRHYLRWQILAHDLHTTKLRLKMTRKWNLLCEIDMIGDCRIYGMVSLMDLDIQMANVVLPDIGSRSWSPQPIRSRWGSQAQAQGTNQIFNLCLLNNGSYKYWHLYFSRTLFQAHDPSSWTSSAPVASLSPLSSPTHKPSSSAPAARPSFANRLEARLVWRRVAHSEESRSYISRYFSFGFVYSVVCIHEGVRPCSRSRSHIWRIEDGHFPKIPRETMVQTPKGRFGIPDILSQMKKMILQNLFDPWFISLCMMMIVLYDPKHKSTLHGWIWFAGNGDSTRVFLDGLSSLMNWLGHARAWIAYWRLLHILGGFGICALRNKVVRMMCCLNICHVKCLDSLH